jgi:hypothetical protein
MKTLVLAAAMTLFAAGGGALWAGVPGLMDGVMIESNGSPISVSDMSSATTVDWNNDGKKDLIVGSGDGKIRYFANTGTDTNPVFSGGVAIKANGVVITVGYASG